MSNRPEKKPSLEHRSNSVFSIVIPSWHGIDLLLQCLDSVFAQRFTATPLSYDIYIVDNGSTQNERRQLLQAFQVVEPDCFEKEAIIFSTEKSRRIDGQDESWIHLICNADNLGFSVAVNQGIQASNGDFVVLLNNDIVLEPYFLQNIFDAFQKHPDWLHAATKIRQFHHRERLDDAGNTLLVTGRAVKIGYGEMDAGQYDAPRVIFSASGAAAVYRRNFFDIVGTFDESFFAYLEDVDIGYRARRMGYACGWIPTAVSYHIGSASTGSMKNAFTARLLAQNQVNLHLKNTPFSLMLLLGIPFFAVLCWQGIQFFRQGKEVGVAFLQGLRLQSKQLRDMLQKRREMKNKSRQTTPELLRELIVLGMQYQESRRKRLR